MLDQCGLLVLIKMRFCGFSFFLSLFFPFVLLDFFVLSLKEEGRMQLGCPNHTKYT